MQNGLVLKAMQMLPSSLYPVMNGLIQTGTGRTAQPLRFTSQIKVNLALIGLEANIGHLPRRLETQG